jgi:hypothetical protein
VPTRHCHDGRHGDLGFPLLERRQPFPASFVAKFNASLVHEFEACQKQTATGPGRWQGDNISLRRTHILVTISIEVG